MTLDLSKFTDAEVLKALDRVELVDALTAQRRGERQQELTKAVERIVTGALTDVVAQLSQRIEQATAALAPPTVAASPSVALIAQAAQTATDRLMPQLATSLEPQLADAAAHSRCTVDELRHAWFASIRLTVEQHYRSVLEPLLETTKRDVRLDGAPRSISLPGVGLLLTVTPGTNGGSHA